MHFAGAAGRHSGGHHVGKGDQPAAPAAGECRQLDAKAARQGARGSSSSGRGRPSAGGGLTSAYAELEIGAGSTDQEVVKAYRRQMNRHHPDKLVANGLPESMAQVAKEKTQRIQEAYEAIRAARGMR